jgi:hypothetical protein
MGWIGFGKAKLGVTQGNQNLWPNDETILTRCTVLLNE